jgi:hypothetical protein
MKKRPKEVVDEQPRRRGDQTPGEEEEDEKH